MIEESDMSEDHGIKNVVLRNMKKAIKQKNFSSIYELEANIDYCKQLIEDAREDMHLAFMNTDGCQHNYEHSKYTIQRRLIGFVRVNSRSCKECGFEDIYQEGTDTPDRHDRPEWAGDAKEQYYNDSF